MNKNYLAGLFVIVFLMSIISVSALTNINTCTTLNTNGETYNITANLTNATLCITLNANNSIITGNKYTITSGIKINGENSTINNINILNGFTDGVRYAIKADGHNMTLNNISILNLSSPDGVPGTGTGCLVTPSASTASLDTYGISAYGINATNIFINARSGNGGDGTNSGYAGMSGTKGANSGNAFGISVTNIIINNFNFNITSGNGGTGGAGLFGGSSCERNGGSGGVGGNSGNSYGIYSINNLSIQNGIINTLTGLGGNGGSAGNPYGGYTAGSGGSGGNSGSAYGSFANQLVLAKNLLYNIQTSNGGNGINGAPQSGIQNLGNGGSGGTSGEIQLLPLIPNGAIINNITTVKILSGNGGTAGNVGAASGGFQYGCNGNGGNSGNIKILTTNGTINLSNILINNITIGTQSLAGTGSPTGYLCGGPTSGSAGTFKGINVSNSTGYMSNISCTYLDVSQCYLPSLLYMHTKAFENYYQTGAGFANILTNSIYYDGSILSFLNVTVNGFIGIPLATYNITAKELNTSITTNYGTTTSLITIDTILGYLYTLTFNSTVLVTKNVTMTNFSQTIDMTPALNISVYDEKLSAVNLTFFNFSKPTSVYQTRYCGNTTLTVLVPNTTTGSSLINPTCAFSKIKYTLNYLQLDGTTTTYDRTIITADLFNTNTLYMKIFLPELKQGTPIYSTALKPYDIFGIYTVEDQTRVLVYKNMPTGTELINSDFVDAQGQTQTYLLAGDLYSLTVFSNNAPLRILGPYTATSEGTKILRLFDVVLTSGATTVQGQIYSDTSIDMTNAASTNSSVLHMLYYDPTNTTTSLHLTLYNGSCDATTKLIFDQTFNSAVLNNTQSTVYYTYNIIGSPFASGKSNIKFCSTYSYVASGVAYSYNETTVYDTYVPKPAFKNEWTLPWMIFLFLLVIALSLNARTVSFGSILITGLASVFLAWNWIAKGVVPGVTVSVIYGLCLLIAIILNIKRQT